MTAALRCCLLFSLAAGALADEAQLFHSFLLTGACDELSELNGQLFVFAGRTASYAPFYKGAGVERYIYHDQDCADGADGRPRWIIDTDRPDVKKVKDLDNDRLCRYDGRIDWADRLRPPFAATWTLLCGGKWEERTITLLEITTTSTTRFGQLESTQATTSKIRARSPATTAAPAVATTAAPAVDPPTAQAGNAASEAQQAHLSASSADQQEHVSAASSDGSHADASSHDSQAGSSVASGHGSQAGTSVASTQGGQTGTSVASTRGSQAGTSVASAGQQSEAWSLILDGACANKGWLNGMVFDEVGHTADGRPFFKAVGRESYIYYDKDCDGPEGSNTLARWVIDGHRPSTTALTDMDLDGKCNYDARWDGDLMRPPALGTWRMYCGAIAGGWADRDIRLRKGSSASTTSRVAVARTAERPGTMAPFLAGTTTSRTSATDVAPSGHAAEDAVDLGPTAEDTGLSGHAVESAHPAAPSHSQVGVNPTQAEPSTTPPSRHAAPTDHPTHVEGAAPHGPAADSQGHVAASSGHTADTHTPAVTPANRYSTEPTQVEPSTTPPFSGHLAADPHGHAADDHHESGDHVQDGHADALHGHGAALATGDSKRYRLQGACAWKGFLNGAVFEQRGSSASGAYWFEAVADGRPQYIYHDLACDGHDDAAPRWIIDDTAPDPSLSRDLDEDGKCNYHARLNGLASASAPTFPLAGSWTVWCGHSWDPLILVFTEVHNEGPAAGGPGSEHVEAAGHGAAGHGSEHGAAHAVDPSHPTHVEDPPQHAVEHADGLEHSDGHHEEGEGTGEEHDEAHDADHAADVHGLSQDALTLWGACEESSFFNGMVFHLQGTTASGASYYKGVYNHQEHVPYYIYFDPSCSGDSSRSQYDNVTHDVDHAMPRSWILDDSEPSTTLKEDLDADGKCEYYARSTAGDASGVPKSASWHMFCGREWQDVTLTFMREGSEHEEDIGHGAAHGRVAKPISGAPTYHAAPRAAAIAAVFAAAAFL